MTLDFLFYFTHFRKSKLFWDVYFVFANSFVRPNISYSGQKFDKLRHYLNDVVIRLTLININNRIKSKEQKTRAIK